MNLVPREPELGTGQGNFSAQDTKQQEGMNSSGAPLDTEGGGPFATETRV